MTTDSIRPLLRLTCAGCGQDMVRYVAHGLLIGDGQAVVIDFNQVCAGCGHEHPPGTMLRYHIGTEQEVQQYE